MPFKVQNILILLLFHFTSFSVALCQSCKAELNFSDTVVCNQGTFELKLKTIDTTIKINLLPRNAGNAVYLNGKIYLVGGDDRINPVPTGNLSQVEIIDLSNNQIIPGAGFPNPRSELGLVVANNKIYAIGGYNGTATNYVNEYDPLTNSWNTKAPMPTARSVFCATTLNNIIYCAGGWPGNIDKLEAFDPVSNTWTTKANMPIPIQNFNSMVAVNGKLYFIGGRNALNTIIYDLVYEYDPLTNAWSQKASLPAPRFSGAAVTDGTEIYYLGGSSTTNIFTSGTNTIFIYNPQTNLWRQSRDSLPTTRTRHSAVYANGQFWVISGLDNSGNVIKDLWSNTNLGYSIRWSTGDTTRSIIVSPANTTTYWGELYNSTSSCRDSVTITVEHPRPGISYPPIFGNVGDQVLLNARPFGQQYLWSPATGLNNPASPNPLLSISGNINFTVQITTPSGCLTVDTLQVKLNLKEGVFVPSAFTPNADGLNDLFKPTLSGIKHLDYFKVYTRWGQLVYQVGGNEPLTGWDGKIKGISQPSEVFVWMLKCTGYSGTVYIKKGSVVLIK
jgi:gliding motility-associated-like protein